jgi:hypothetical protein
MWFPVIARSKVTWDLSCRFREQCKEVGGEFEKHLQQDSRSEEDTIGSSGEEREIA